MTQATEKETFEAFIKSFFYGARSDLSFKFISDFNEEQASDFLRNLFWDLIDGLDDRDLAGLKQRIVDGQTAAYSHQKNFDYNEGPFTPLPGPLSGLKLTLLTSSGHFPADRDPKPFGVENMTQAEAEARAFEFLRSAPELSEIPFDSSAGDLRVRHGGYDIRAALKDPNVSFPFQRMTELQDKGTFASLTDNAYSFVGVCSQKKLLKNILSGWVEIIKRQGARAAVLVPV